MQLNGAQDSNNKTQISKLNPNSNNAHYWMLLKRPLIVRNDSELPKSSNAMTNLLRPADYPVKFSKNHHYHRFVQKKKQLLFNLCQLLNIS